MIKLPGLIAPHVHVREPRQTHKEEWGTATQAALAGGVTLILAMPNTKPPIFDHSTLDLALDAAKNKAHCDYAQFLGAGPDNAEIVAGLAHKAAGLKMYLDSTFGELRLDDMTLWMPHFEKFPKDSPVVLHSESRTMAAGILFSAIYDRPVHIAHVSLKEEILLIKAAKENLKKIALILLSTVMVMVLLGVSTRNVQALEYGCDLLYPGMTLSAKCDEIHFVLGWAAMTPGQINEFLNAMQWTFTLRDGSGNVLKIISPDQVAPFWSPAYPIDPADLGVDCGMPRAWETDLVLPLGKLGRGNYTITLDENFSHPITDGFNACWVDGFKIPVFIYPTTYSFTGPFSVK